MSKKPELIEIYLDENGDEITPNQHQRKQQEDNLYEDVGNTKSEEAVLSTLQVY